MKKNMLALLLAVFSLVLVTVACDNAGSNNDLAFFAGIINGAPGRLGEIVPAESDGSYVLQSDGRPYSTWVDLETSGKKGRFAQVTVGYSWSSKTHSNSLDEEVWYPKVHSEFPMPQPMPDEGFIRVKVERIGGDSSTSEKSIRIRTVS